jgi:hypothetical protein
MKVAAEPVLGRSFSLIQCQSENMDYANDRQNERTLGAYDQFINPVHPSSDRHIHNVARAEPISVSLYWRIQQDRLSTGHYCVTDRDGVTPLLCSCRTNCQSEHWHDTANQKFTQSTRANQWRA